MIQIVKNRQNEQTEKLVLISPTPVGQKVLSWFATIMIVFAHVLPLSQGISINWTDLLWIFLVNSLAMGDVFMILNLQISNIVV